MEHFDVAIVGGGSAGLAALRQLSNLGKQAVPDRGWKDSRLKEYIRWNSLLKETKEW